MRVCEITGCDRKHYGKGFCGKHYLRHYRHGSPDSVKLIRTTGDPYLDLLAFGFERSGECLLSKSGKMHGYSVFKKGGTFYWGHRIAFEKWHGPIPDGLVVDHMCHNEAAAQGLCSGGRGCLHRSCVNPAHLRAVTSGENSAASAVTAGAIRRGRTHCKRGHPYDAENTRLRSNGHRECRACKHITYLERRIHSG